MYMDFCMDYGRKVGVLGCWGVSGIKKLRERKGVKKKCERKYNGRIVGMDISIEKAAIYWI